MIKLVACIFMALVGVGMIMHGDNKLRYRDYPEVSAALILGGAFISLISACVAGVTTAELFGY